MNKRNIIFLVAILLICPFANASVQSSLLGLKDLLLDSILPVFAVIGLGFAAFSFFTGNPRAKEHLMYAIAGAAICFGAQSIVDLLQRVVG